MARFDDLFTHAVNRCGLGVPGWAAGAAGLGQDGDCADPCRAGDRSAASGYAAARAILVGVAVGSNQVNARKLELLRRTRRLPHTVMGLLVTDDSGDREDGTKTAAVSRYWLGRYGKIDNGLVTLTILWAGKRSVSWGYALARHFAEGRTIQRSVPGWRSADLAVQAQDVGRVCCVPSGRRRLCLRGRAGGPCRAGRSWAGLPFMMALHSAADAARALAWDWSGRLQGLAAGDADVPRRVHRNLLGCRRDAERLVPGRSPSPGGGPLSRPPGIRSPTCLAPAACVKLIAITPPPAWPR